MKPVIFIGNTPVDIEQKITIVLRSPVFNEKGIPGSYAFNFSVPLTAKVKEEISFSHLPGASHKVYSKQVSIKAGAFSLTGRATITAKSENSIEIALPVMNSSLKSKLLNINLTDLPLGTYDNIVDYVTIAALQPAFYSTTIFNEWHQYSMQNIVNHPLRFANIIRDDHNTLPGEVPYTYRYYVAPATGKYIFSFNVRYNVIAGKNLIFRARKNDSVTVFEKTISQPLIDQSVTDFITFSPDLNQGDTIHLRVMLSTMPFQHPSQNHLTHRANVQVYSDSVFFAFSNYNFDYLVDRGYPYNNITFLPIFNNNYFANASESLYEIDEASLDFLNKKFPIVNFWDNGFPMFLHYSQDDESYHMYNVISPSVFLAHIMKTMFVSAGIKTLSNPFTGDGSINQLCIHANACINNISSPAFNNIPQSFKIADMLPRISCIDFLSDICKTLGIVFAYDPFDESLSFKNLHDIINDHTATEFSENILGKPIINVNPYNNFTVKYQDNDDPFISEFFKDPAHVNFKGSVPSYWDLPSFFNNQINDCYYVTELNAYFFWTKSQVLNMHFWHLYALSFNFERTSKSIAGKQDSTFDYVLPSQPVMMRYYPLSDPSWGQDREMLLPASFLPGKIKGIPGDDPSYRLLFFRGLQKDSNQNDYPLGSNAYKNLFGDICFDNELEKPFDLELNLGENSIFTKRLKDYVSWRVYNHGEYTFHKIMTSEELARFDFFLWYRIHGMDYLVKELKFEITGNGLSPAEILAVPRDAAIALDEPAAWLLTSGFWNMSGAWDDHAKWIMEP